jgi:hypothetical protein
MGMRGFFSVGVFILSVSSALAGDRIVSRVYEMSFQDQNRQYSIFKIDWGGAQVLNEQKQNEGANVWCEHSNRESHWPNCYFGFANQKPLSKEELESLEPKMIEQDFVEVGWGSVMSVKPSKSFGDETFENSESWDREIRIKEPGSRAIQRALGLDGTFDFSTEFLECKKVSVRTMTRSGPGFLRRKFFRCVLKSEAGVLTHPGR